MSQNKRSYRFSPLAEADLEEIWLYTFRQWSVEQAEEYHNAIIAGIEGLASGSNVPQRTDVRDGYWKYRIGMHVLYFRCSDEYLAIISLANGNIVRCLFYGAGELVFILEPTCRFD